MVSWPVRAHCIGALCVAAILFTLCIAQHKNKSSLNLCIGLASALFRHLISITLANIFPAMDISMILLQSTWAVCYCILIPIKWENDNFEILWHYSFFPAAMKQISEFIKQCVASKFIWLSWYCINPRKFDFDFVKSFNYLFTTLKSLAFRWSMCTCESDSLSAKVGSCYGKFIDYTIHHWYVKKNPKFFCLSYFSGHKLCAMEHFPSGTLTILPHHPHFLYPHSPWMTVWRTSRLDLHQSSAAPFLEAAGHQQCFVVVCAPHLESHSQAFSWIPGQVWHRTSDMTSDKTARFSMRVICHLMLVLSLSTIFFSCWNCSLCSIIFLFSNRKVLSFCIYIF